MFSCYFETIKNFKTNLFRISAPFVMQFIQIAVGASSVKSTTFEALPVLGTVLHVWIKILALQWTRSAVRQIVVAIGHSIGKEKRHLEHIERTN